MMHEHLAALAERRERLVARAAEEREALATGLARADQATGWLHAGLSIVDRARRHPLLVAGAAAALVALRPRITMKWLLRAWTLWRTLRSMRAAL